MSADNPSPRADSGKIPGLNADGRPDISAPATTTIVQAAPQQTWFDKGFKVAIVILMFAGMLLVASWKKQGKISDEDAAQAVQILKTFGPALMASKAPDDTTTIAVSDDNSKATVTIKPPAVAAKAPADKPREFSPDDLEKWLPLIQKGAEIWAQVVKPTPVPGPTPSEQSLLDQIAKLQEFINSLKPAPTPNDTVVPKPLPDNVGTLKLKVTDISGQAITSATVQPGRLLLVRLEGATGKVKWNESVSSNDAQAGPFDDNGYAIVLAPDSWVELVATDFGSQQQIKMRLTANKAPQPPPTPTPVPTVDVKPTPKPAGELRVFVVYESSQNHSRAQDLILASVTSGRINDALNSRCSKAPDGRPNWRRWDKDIVYSPTGAMASLWQQILEPAKSKGLPAVVVACGDDITIYPIDKDAVEDSVLSVLTCGSAD